MRAFLPLVLGETEVEIYFWHVFHYKTNTFALSMCFLPSVRSETGVGAVSMSLSVLGPA